MPIEHTANRPALGQRVARLVFACLLTLAAVGAPVPARAQGDPPPPHPARGPEDDPHWLTPKDGDGTSAAPGVLEGAQSAAGRLAVQSFRDGNWEIYFGSDNAYAVHSRLTADPAADIEPRLSPDATRIVFTSKRSGNYELWLINVDGSGLRQLTNDPATDSAAAWSPDGTQIAFASGRGGNTDVYVMKADGSAVSRLTTNVDYDGEPAWSPDGTLIAFISRRSAGTADYFLYTMTAQGGSPLLRSTTPYASRPNWSPDGTRILFDGANASGWQRLFLVTLSNGVVQETATSGFYKPNYDVWAGSWGFGAQAYATLVSYVQYQGTWYVESMSILSIDTPSGAAGGISPQTRDAMPDWRSADRLPPQSLILPANPYRVAVPSGGYGLTVNAWDQGIAGVDRIEVQSRMAGGEWQASGLQCFGDGPTYGCLGMPPLQNIDLRARAVDRMGNAEPWPDNPDLWARIRPYLLTVSGQVTDLRSTLLAQVPIVGAPAYDPQTITGPDGHYRLYVPNLATPLAFTMTATVPGGAMSDPHAFALDGPPTAYEYAQATADFVVRPMDQALIDPGFETGPGAWSGSDDLSPQWLAPDQVYGLTGRLHLGWEDGERALTPLVHEPHVAITATATLISYVDDQSRNVFLRCPADGQCDPPQYPGGSGTLAFAVAPNGGVGLIDTPEVGPRTFRQRSAAGVWSAPEDVAFAGGTGHLLLADPAGGWHVLWAEADGLIRVSHRNVNGNWTSAVDVATLANGWGAAFDSQSRLHVLGCSASGVIERTWSVAEGFSASAPVAPVCDAEGFLSAAVDTGGEVYAVWRGNTQLVFSHRALAGAWSSPIVFEPASRSFQAVVPGHAGRPALILKDLAWDSYGELSYAEATPTGQWMSGIFGPQPRSREPWPVAAWNTQTERLIVSDPDMRYYFASDVVREVAALSDGTVDAGLTRSIGLAPAMHRPTLALTYRHESPGATLTAWVQAAGGGAPLVQSLPGGAGWQRNWIDLSAWVGQTVTVTINLQGVGGAWPVVDFDEIQLGSWTTPVITSLTPAQFDTAAGTLTVTGDNFIPTPTVTIGGLPAIASVIDAQHLSVTVPPALGAGRRALVVTNPDGFATAAAQPVQIGRGLVNLPSLLRLIPGGWTTNVP